MTSESRVLPPLTHRLAEQLPAAPLRVCQSLARQSLRGLLLFAALLLAGCETGAPPLAEPVADAATPADLHRQVAALMPSLERLSGLERTEMLRLRRHTRQEARQYIERRMQTELPPEMLEGARRTYAALGLLPDTLDLGALMLDLFTEQVLGYYDPTTRTMYVVEGAEADALQPVLAHELVHALQDQHTSLDSLVARHRGNDRQTAAHAAMEGHAMLVMFAVLAEQATGREIDPATLPSPATELGPALAAQTEQYPVFRRAPPIIQETLLFPYLRGADFVHQLWVSQQPQDRYPAPIGELLPQSTEQIMRPVDRFIERRDEPIEVRFDDVATYSVVYENTFGQLETSIYLAQHLGDAARAAAHGWGGDRFLLVASGDGTDPAPADAGASDVLYWVSVWDAAADADAFAEASRRAAAQRPGRDITVERAEIGGRPAVAITDAPAGVMVATFPRATVQSR